jgi:hypothetical protein
VATRRHSGKSGAVWERSLDATDGAWTNIGHALTAVALAALERPGESALLFCVTTDGRLWCRERGSAETSWKTIALGCGARTLAAVQVPGAGAKLFCTTADQLLYVRDAVTTEAAWHCLGDALGVTALAALAIPDEGAALYCATDHQVVYRRDAAAGPNTPWKAIAEAALVCGLAAASVPGEGPQLFCATTDRVLYRRSLNMTGVAWNPVGKVPFVLALAAADGRLLLLTPGEREIITPIPHQIFLPVRKHVDITAHVGTAEPRRITITDEFGKRLAGWVSEKALDSDPTRYFAEHGSTPGAVAVDVLYERQYDGDPDWYGMRCKVRHQRGAPGTPEELTVGADDIWVKFRWSR